MGSAKLLPTSRRSLDCDYFEFDVDPLILFSFRNDFFAID